MTRLALWMVASLCLVGCSTKPSEDECHQAITNMTRLMGTENLADTSAIQSQVRRCKGGSTKKSVQCAIKAQTLDDLRKCDFFKVPENAKGIGADTAGSAAVGSGSAAAGSAVGLGNVWRFPYMTAENGGAAFVLLYLGCVVLIGVPVLLAELSMGRASGKNAVGAFEALHPTGSKRWRFVGGLGVFTGLAILSFYSVIAGWTLSYLGRALVGSSAFQPGASTVVPLE